MSYEIWEYIFIFDHNRKSATRKTFFPPLLNFYLEPRQIFLTCKSNPCKLEVRNSSKNFFFSKKYLSSDIFFQIEKLVLLFLFLSLAKWARLTSFWYLMHLFVIFQQNLTSFEKSFRPKCAIHLNFVFFWKRLDFPIVRSHVFLTNDPT